MDLPRPRRLFFTGTGTEVGKTYIAALAVKELRSSGQRVAVYKPVASGCDLVGDDRISSDAVALWEASGRRDALHAVCPQRFVAPLAPPAAAAAEGRCVDETLLIDGLGRITSDADVIIVEGAGGLLSPVSDHWLNSDLAAKLDAELVIVAVNRLGAIHQVLSTALAAKALGLPVAGIVLNAASADSDPSAASNADWIRRFTKIPLLANLSLGSRETGIQWEALLPAARTTAQIPQAWL
jgi:dethiobiotin synthetase